MRFNKVAVLYGGDTSEREVSLVSGQAVFDALNKYNMCVELIDPSITNLSYLKSENFDAVFIALHGGSGENGETQTVLQMMNISYTGSDARACLLSYDKYLTKLLWADHGLPIADYVMLSDKLTLESCEHLGFPLFIKPTCEGSSIGVHKINNQDELNKAYQALSQNYLSIMAETFLSGSEFSCPILGDEALPVVRIESTNDFYDYHAKYVSHDTVYHCPAGLSPTEEQYVREISLCAFKSLGCHGWGRVDLRQDKNGKLHLLEMNTAPGMTGHSLVPMSARQHGLSFEELCLRILSYAI